MKTRIAACVALVLLALPLPLVALGEESPSDAVSRILGTALSRSRAYETLTHLTDRIGPRLAGSANLERAVEWTSAELGRYGLDRVWTEPVRVPHWVRGTETGRVVSPVDHPMAITALGMSDPTPEGGISAEVVEVSSFEEVRNAGDRLRGKIVLYNKPIQAGFVGANGYGSAVGLRYKGASEASRQGAVGMLIRSLGTASYRLPHTGAQAYDDDVPRIPAAAISAEDADLIHRFLEMGEPVVVRFELGCRLLPDEADSANVLAEIRGREKPEEVVLIGAHLDSWDVGTGAIDDGAGCAVVVETLRLIRSLDLRPRRTIRGVLFTNEENGLRGGKNYAEVHAAELGRHVAAIESDSGGARPLGFGVTAGPGAMDTVARIASALRVIGADDVRDGGGGADISPTKDAGVPQMNLRQDATRYFDYHHTVADTLDKVDPDDLAKNVGAMAVMAWSLAESSDVLPRYVPEPENGPRQE